MTVSRTVAAGLIAIGLATMPAGAAAGTPASAAGGGEPAAPRVSAEAGAAVQASVVRWSTDKRWRGGERNGVRVGKGSIRIGHPVGVRRWKDPFGDGPARRYAFGRWRSPWVGPSFRFSNMIPSWSAPRMPKGTWLQPEVRVRTTGGRLGSWDVLGHWQGRLRGIHDSTLGWQGDDVAGVAVDTVLTDSPAKAWQLRLTLYRRVGSDRTPVVASVSGVASTSAPDTITASEPGPGRGHAVAVPRYSQMTHRGHYPQWGGGGEAWCSPTSTAMIMKSWHRGPKPEQYGWVNDSDKDPWVDHAARMTFDHRYDGTGNWAFNTAYASTRGLDAFVTRLPSLRAAERYIKAGIPLVLSISFDKGELPDAYIGSSNGHLLVLRGFTRRGDAIVNDPAWPRNRGVGQVYDRADLERAWLTASAGTTYVIHPKRVALPRTP